MPLARAHVGFGLAAVGVLVLVLGSACGTEPVGVESCRRIERVRCESAPGCGISLERPVHEGDSPVNDVAACIRYYDDQCLHGLVAPNDPGPQAVDACVNAIITGTCQVVAKPESDPACAFLVPPAPPVAAADASADTTTFPDAAGD